MNSTSKIGVIVILYKSDRVNVAAAALPQSSVLIVVDNTPGQDLGLSANENLIYIPLGDNLGIAEAQNRGIRAAKESGCSHIVFFDQDSQVPDNFVSRMVGEYERISVEVPNLFLLGPTVYNGRDGQEYKSTVHADTVTGFDFIPRREIISSGSCVAMDKVERVGLLDSRLFIDYVDFEWCWRANALGMQSGITPRIVLTHFVGRQEYRFLNQLIIVSAPFRYFFQMRNMLWLMRYRYVPSSWKVNSLIKEFLFLPSYPFNVKQWREILRQKWRGFKAGIKSPQQENKNHE